MRTDTDSEESTAGKAPATGTPSAFALASAPTHRLDSPVTPARAATAGPPVSAERARGPTIRTQIFLATGLLVLLALGTAVSVASWRANTVAEGSIREALEKVPTLFENYLSNLEALLKEKLRSIAEEPGTKSLFASADAPTRWEFAADVAKLHGARTVFLFDRASAVLARSDKPAGEGIGQPFGSVRWVADVLDSMRESAAAIREKESISLVASTPVLSGEPGNQVLNGVLAASFPLDEERARQFQALTRGEVGFLVDVAKRNEPPRFALSAATAGLGGADFVTALAAVAGAAGSPLSEGRSGGSIDLEIAGERRIVVTVPIRSASGEILGAAVVSRSRAEETAAFHEIRDTLLGVGAVALLLAIPLSLAVGRGIARPIEQLAAAATAIREGDLSVALPAGGAGEVGALARAFGRMRDDLREKTALEELVAETQKGHGEETGPSPGGIYTDTVAAPRKDAGTEPGAGGGEPASASPRVGKVLGGRYKIAGVIGRGGMGEVYRAVDRELDEEVALKILAQEGFASGDAGVEALKQEIRLARKISHPNVTRTHDLGEADGLRFLTMEYVPGLTLRRLIDRRGPLALGPGLQISKQILRGLSAVHDARILHGDIKPHNVMVLPNGVVKLMDFGIAQVAGFAPRLDGQVSGTPAYMSPEQARGEPLDARSDLYAAGTVMFETFTGTRPFDGPDAMSVIRARISRDPPRPTQFRPNLPASLDRIILSMIARKPDDRPASAREVYAALMRVTA